MSFSMLMKNKYILQVVKQLNKPLMRYYWQYMIQLMRICQNLFGVSREKPEYNA